MTDITHSSQLSLDAGSVYSEAYALSVTRQPPHPFDESVAVATATRGTRSHYNRIV